MRRRAQKNSDVCEWFTTHFVTLMLIGVQCVVDNDLNHSWTNHELNGSMVDSSPIVKYKSVDSDGAYSCCMMAADTVDTPLYSCQPISR